jgi:hypothetical protein
MKELITRPQANALIWGIGAFGVIAFLVAAGIARRRGQSAAKYGALCGGPMLAAAILWPIYNAIEDHFGLDSLAALGINFALFLAVGATCGTLWTRHFPGSGARPDAPEPAGD